MGKTYKTTRLWLLLLLCCFATASKASEIAITGYTPSDEHNGAPLFELNETLIEVRLADHTLFNSVYVDDTAIIEYGSPWTRSCELDISAYNDNSIHKLELSHGKGNVCYFKFGSVVYTPDKNDIVKIHYEIKNNEAEVVSVSQDIKVAIIRSEYWTENEDKSYPVTSIREGAFNNCSNLISVRIPESISSINVNAFEGCNSLESVYFNATNCSVSGYASEDCWDQLLPPSIKRAMIGNNVKTIPDNLFYGCSGLTSITIPESVTSIGDRSFADCSGLTSITIPESVTSIGDNSFDDCSGLTSINIPESVTSIGLAAFGDCSGLTSVYIPQHVAQIGHCPFYGCNNLQLIDVSSNNEYYSSTMGILLTKDETELIQWPEGKEPCNIPSSVTKIAWGAFAGNSSLKTIIIPNSVVEIGPGAFGWSGLTSITIPNSVTTIGEMAFQNCPNLTSVYIPSSVTSIGKGAFDTYGNPAKVEFESIESLSRIHFEDQFSNPLINADDFYINGEKITDLIIPETVTSIGAYSFYCKGLTSITIPAPVTTIGCNAFGNCYNCSSVTCLSTIPPALDSEAFHVKETATLYVPHGSIASYQNSDWAQFFANIEEIKDSLTVDIKGNGRIYYTNFEEVANGAIFDGSDFIFFVLPDKNNRVSAITLDGEDITANLNNHKLTISDFSGTSTLKIEFTPEAEATLTVRGADNHSFTHVYCEGTEAIVRLQCEAEWDIHSVTYNGEDVTDRIVNNMFETEPLHGDNNLNMVLVSNKPAKIGEVESGNNNVTISIRRNAVTVNGLNPNETIGIYDLEGRIVYSGFDRTVYLKPGSSYILTTPSETFKIAI